jgi:predicted nucleotidyltransferase
MEKELKRILEKARKDKDVLAVTLFGSYARKRTLPSSDIDVCLMLKPKRLSSLFISNKKLEYLSMVSSKYDIQIFQQIPVFIRVRILKEGKFLLNKDYDSMFRVAISSIKEFELFKKHYLYCIKSVAYGR